MFHKLSMFNLRNFGVNLAVTITTKTVKIPPTTIDGFKPNALAVVPDSKAPISFDEPMKIELTADTLPRISSGVKSCTNIDRIKTDTASKAPESISSANESQ